MQSEGFRSGQASGPLAENRHSRAGGNPGALFGTNTDHKNKPEFLGSGLPPERRAGGRLRVVPYRYEAE